MALGIQPLAEFEIVRPGGAKGKVKLVKFTGDTDIPAADTGYTLSASSFGLTGLSAIVPCGNETTGVYFPTFTPLTASTFMFQWFNADDAVEAAAGENAVENLVIYALVIGY